MQRERQRLAREQAELAEKLAADAKLPVGHTSLRTSLTRISESCRCCHSQRCIVRRVAAVLSSEGVNVPIETQSFARRTIRSTHGPTSTRFISASICSMTSS